MAFARINDIVLHHELAGPSDGPALVFVNSLGTDARIWDGTVRHFTGRYRCLTYDKRGHGLSDTPTGDYSLDDHLDDLEGLLDRTGCRRAVLVGVSVGGLIAQGLALRSPQRLAGLVLCDTASRIGDARFWDARMSTVTSGGMASIADGIMERWFSPGFRQARPDDMAGWRNLLLRTDPRGYVGTCATLRDTDLTGAVGNIELATLVIAGDADLATPPDVVRACADAIPGARFEVMAGVGHIPSIEQPDALAAEISRFLKELGHG